MAFVCSLDQKNNFYNYWKLINGAYVPAIAYCRESKPNSLYSTNKLITANPQIISTEYKYFQPKVFDIIPINTTSLDQNVVSTGREAVKIEDNSKIYIFEKLNMYKSDELLDESTNVQSTLFWLSAKAHNVRGPLEISFCSGEGDEDNDLFGISPPFYNGFSLAGSTIAILAKKDLVYENKSEYSIRVRAEFCGWDECYYFEKSFKIILVKADNSNIEVKTDMVVLLDNYTNGSIYSTIAYEGLIKKIDAFANIEFAAGEGDDDNHRFLISKGMYTDFQNGIGPFACQCFTTCYTLLCHNTEGLSDGDYVSLRLKLYNQDRSYSNSTAYSCDNFLLYNNGTIPVQPRLEYVEKVLKIPVYQLSSVPRTDKMTDFSLVVNTLDATYPEYLYLWIIHPKEYMFLDENIYIRIEYTKDNGLNWNFLIDTYSIGGTTTANSYYWVFFNLKNQIFYTVYDQVSGNQQPYDSPISHCETVQFRCATVDKAGEVESLSDWTYSNIFSTLSSFGEDCSNQVQSKSLYVSYE